MCGLSPQPIKTLKKKLRKKVFREDLFYRLNVIPITVPPLRERKQDIEVLVKAFLKECARRHGTEKKRMSAEGVKMLSMYEWPGNVRELKNLIERLAIMVEKEVIEISDIPSPYNPEAVCKADSNGVNLFEIDSLSDAQKAFEKEFIRLKYKQYNEDASLTARQIGVDNKTIDKSLKEP